MCAEKEEGGCGGVAQVAILGVVHVNSGHATRRKIDNGGASDIIVHKRQSGLDMPSYTCLNLHCHVHRFQWTTGTGGSRIKAKQSTSTSLPGNV